MIKVVETVENIETVTGKTQKTVLNFIKLLYVPQGKRGLDYGPLL
jgi:hypothetical protein